jgi:transposase
MKIESWVESHIEAFEYFGGVPRLLVPDNAKTAVTKAGRYEVELNRTYRDMADYYGTAVVPARPRSPKDKAPVETGVQIVERRIIAKLRHSQFFSLEEVREAAAAERETLNDQAFQKLPGSRRSVFLETERHELMKLPAQRYQLAQFKRAKVGFDYHVALDKAHYYSVPYQYAGKEVLIRATSRTVEILCEGERIACHVRAGDSRRFITDPAHMPQNHRIVSQWSPQRFLSWAAKSGDKTRSYIAALLERTSHPEQAYRTCAGILRLASTVSAERMEQAAGEALAGNIYSYAWFRKLLEATGKREPVIHGNLRGKAYYEGDSHAE